jgi:glycosyltransferase involved in cell wall biosynthesis
MYETINDFDLETILPRLARRTARLIYVADKNLSALRQFGLLDEAKVVRIDNALSPEDFEPVSRSSLGIPEDAFVLTLVSRALVDKGWAEAIEAVTQAREKSGIDMHLLLVGDGPEYERLAAESLPAFIHLEGFQRNVRGYFAASDLGFLPSRFRGESFPLVIIECLQSGRPVLATDLGEIRGMLDGPHGMAGELIELNGDSIDTESLAAAIAALAIDSDGYRKRLAAVPAAALKFDPGILASRHDAAYREAMAE